MRIVNEVGVATVAVVIAARCIREAVGWTVKTRGIRFEGEEEVIVSEEGRSRGRRVEEACVGLVMWLGLALGTGGTGTDGHDV